MKIAKIAIFLTGMIGLAMGGLMSISSLRTQQLEAQIRNVDHLKSEAQVLVDQFFGAIESTKNLSQNNINLSALPYVTHVGVVKMNQALPVEFESLATRDQMQLGVGKDGKALDALPDLALEDRILKELRQHLSYGDLQITKFSIGTYEPTEHSNREGIYVATPIYKMTNGVVDPTIIDKVNLTLLDPTKIMASLTKVARTGRNAFLIDRDGRVLAHSTTSFIGSELKKFETLKEPIENLFLGAQTGIVTQYTSVDGQKEQVAFVRAGVYPFAIASEQTAAPAVLSHAWWSDQASSGAARQNLGMILVLSAVALALFAGTSIVLAKNAPTVAVQQSRARRQRDQETDQSVAPTTGDHYAPSFQRWTAGLKQRQAFQAPAPSALNPAVPSTDAKLTSLAPDETDVVRPDPVVASRPPQFQSSGTVAQAAEKAAESFVESRGQLQESQEVRKQSANRILIAKDYEREFADRIKNNYTLETIERELTGVASELTESPVLYFRYQRQSQNLNLASVSGEVQIPNYALMQAYIRKDIEQQVERLASEGRVASIANYAPVSKLMISNLNTAHFEAWVVTSDPEISGAAKMVGVVVILQAGFRSAQTRPVLANILKEAGNYLYAQTSKIRPRRYDETSTEVNRNLGLNA